MKEQPNLSKEEAIIKYFKGVGKDPILKKLQIDRKMSLIKAENNKKFNLAILDDGLQDKKINYDIHYYGNLEILFKILNLLIFKNIKRRFKIL